MARSLALISAGVLMAAISGCSHNETSSSNTGYPPPATPAQSQQAAAQTNAPSPASSEGATAAQNETGSTSSMSEMSGRPSRAEVRQVQTALKQSGERVKVDGKWGPATSQALRNYQQKNGLEASGQLDEPTMQKLNIHTSG